MLDTNVLMHDPTSLYRFEEHDLYVPIMTLEELDNNKKGTSEVARNARQASRMLDEIVSASENGIADRHRARGPLARPGHRAPAPADRGDRHHACRPRCPPRAATTRSSPW